MTLNPYRVWSYNPPLEMEVNATCVDEAIRIFREANPVHIPCVSCQRAD